MARRKYLVLDRQDDGSLAVTAPEKELLTFDEARHRIRKVTQARLTAGCDEAGLSLAIVADLDQSSWVRMHEDGAEERLVKEMVG